MCHACARERCTDSRCAREQRRGKKVLVLDPRISGFLGLLAEVPLLKEHGVEQCALPASPPGPPGLALGPCRFVYGHHP